MQAICYACFLALASSNPEDETTCFSETPFVFHRITLRYVPEDRIPRNHRCEHLNSCIFMFHRVHSYYEYTGHCSALCSLSCT
jgi:hypothetical protein